MTANRLALIAAVTSVVLAVAGLNEAAPATPPTVAVAKVVTRPTTRFVEFTGSLTAIQQVKLRPRGAGYIQDVSVPEGQFVPKVRRLFLIDHRVFQASLDARRPKTMRADFPPVQRH